MFLLIFYFEPQLNFIFKKSEPDSNLNILKTKHAGDNVNQKKYKQWYHDNITLKDKIIKIKSLIMKIKNTLLL